MRAFNKRYSEESPSSQGDSCPSNSEFNSRYTILGVGESWSSNDK
jgi:hypothetical protein